MDPIPKAAGSKPVIKKNNPWQIISLILALALVAVLAWQWWQNNKGQENITIIAKEEAGNKILDFVNKIYGSQLGTLTLKETAEENGLYKVTFTLIDPTTNQPVDQPAYVTKDGKLFIPQVINISEALTQFETFQQQQQLQQQPTLEPTPEAGAE